MIQVNGKKFLARKGLWSWLPDPPSPSHAARRATAARPWFLGPGRASGRRVSRL